MGLVPEFFMLLGIDVFLAMSLLSAVLDHELPSRLQYLFQVAAASGLGELLISQGFINGGVFGQASTDLTRSWVSIAYLAFSLSSVAGINLYLAGVRRSVTIASVFSGTVTVPILVTSAIIVSSFLGTAGQVSFSPTTTLIVGVSVLFTSLAAFGLMREASKHITETKGLGLPLILASMLGEGWIELLKEKEGDY